MIMVFSRISHHTVIHSCADVSFQGGESIVIQGLELVEAVRGWGRGEQHHTIGSAILDAFQLEVGDMVVKKQKHF